MSAQATNWSYRSQPGTALQKLILVYLADGADDTAQAERSLDQISAWTDASVKSVQRALDALQTNRYLTRVHRGDGRGRLPNLFQLHLDGQNQAAREGVVNPALTVSSGVTR